MSRREPPLPPISRRQFLAGVGSAGAGAALASLLPAIVDKAYAASSKVGCGDLRDIEHFVFVMQENRSFDHYFGTLSGVRGFDDPTAMRHTVGGKPYSIFSQFGYEPGKGTTNSGYTNPFELDLSLTQDGEFLNDPTHDWVPQHECWNGGRMDAWIPTHASYDGDTNAPIVMSHYNRQTLPFYYALADAYTICDNYHCSVLGPTYPNRLYWMSGMLDPNGTGGGPMLQTLGSELPAANIFSWKTMPEVLEEEGISWKVYQSTDAIEGLQGGLLMDNVLRLFTQYGDITSPLNQKGLLPTIELNFIEDIVTGQLPAVSWIVTDFTQCEHPAAPPELGALAVYNILNYLMANPAVWEKTAVIISYDENGGFFDHVPPPTPPPGTKGEYITAKITNPSVQGVEGDVTGPIGLGFRVPCLVLSPFSTGGLKYSGVLDHTSQLRLIESRFGTEVPNLTAWRRSAVGDLTGAFDFASEPDSAHPNLPIPLADLGLTQDLVLANALNAGLGTLGSGIAYTVPANTTAAQEAGPARKAPSGMVCSAPSPGAHVESSDQSRANSPTALLTASSASDSNRSPKSPSAETEEPL